MSSFEFVHAVRKCLGGMKMRFNALRANQSLRSPWISLVGSLLIISGVLFLVFFPWDVLLDDPLRQALVKHTKLYSYFYDGDPIETLKTDPLHHQLLLIMEEDPCRGHPEPFLVVVRMEGNVNEPGQRQFIKELSKQMREGYSSLGCIRAFIFGTDSGTAARGIFDSAKNETQMATMHFIEDRQLNWDFKELDNDLRWHTVSEKVERKHARDIIYIFRRIGLVTESNRVLYMENSGRSSLCADSLKRALTVLQAAEQVQRTWDSIILQPYTHALLIHTDSMLRFAAYASDHIHTARIHELFSSWRDKDGRKSFVSSGTLLNTRNEKCNHKMISLPGLAEQDCFNAVLCKGKWVFPCASGQRNWAWFNSLSRWVTTFNIPAIDDKYY